MYGSTIWSMTSKDNLLGVFKLQKRAARVILNATSKASRTDTLFHKLNWIPFFDELTINTCALIFKRLHDECPEYLSCKLFRISDGFSKSTTFSDLILRCSRYLRELYCGRTFAVRARKLWYSQRVSIECSPSLKSFKILQESLCGADHFIIS